jgi:uncharacterized protein
MRGAKKMKAMNILTLVLLIIGGINWGLVGLFQFDLVAALFGGQDALLARIVYVLVGISALWQIMPLVRGTRTNEVHAEHSRR